MRRPACVAAPVDRLSCRLTAFTSRFSRVCPACVFGCFLFPACASGASRGFPVVQDSSLTFPSSFHSPPSSLSLIQHSPGLLLPSTCQHPHQKKKKEYSASVIYSFIKPPYLERGALLSSRAPTKKKKKKGKFGGEQNHFMETEPSRQAKEGGRTTECFSQ